MRLLMILFTRKARTGVAAWVAFAAFAGAAVSLSSQPVHAYETDQLTGRSNTAPDCGPEVDAYVNAFLSKAAQELEEKLNRRARFARLSDAEIGERLRDEIADENPFHGRYFGARIEVWMRFHLGAKGYAVPAYGSIYHDYAQILASRDWRPNRMAPFVFMLAGSVSGELSSASYISEGVRFGADKLSHFFRLGYRYWKKSDQGRHPENGIRYGTETENGFLGYSSIGVFSYADLAANYDGYRFFRDLVAPPQADPDQLQRAFFRVEREPGKKRDLIRIRQLRPFRLAEYIADDWDEVLNPNVYRKELDEVIQLRLTTHRKRYCHEYSQWRDVSSRPRQPMRPVSVYSDMEHSPQQADAFRMDALCGY